MDPALATIVSDVRNRAGAASSISLFLDFDGTLVPIAADPKVPRLDPSTAETLKLLSRRGSLTTTIISGRAVEDLYVRIRLEGLIYAGNHGLEIFGHGLRFVEPVAAARRFQLERLCEQLTEKLQSVPGALVEYKGLTASVHYRRATTEGGGRIQEAVYALTAPYGAQFRINPGRKVFEIVPRTNWHKGAAVHWINNHFDRDALTIYLGDDTTDEDAFAALPEAITIKVGSVPASCARYLVPDPATVHEFLLWLAAEDPRAIFDGRASAGHP